MLLFCIDVFFLLFYLLVLSVYVCHASLSFFDFICFVLFLFTLLSFLIISGAVVTCISIQVIFDPRL